MRIFKIFNVALALLFMPWPFLTSKMEAQTTNPMQRELYCPDAGSTDTYACAMPTAPSALVTGRHYWFKANTANTGAASINFNSLGAKTIKKAVGGVTTDLADNDIRAGQWVDLIYDGTNMQIQSTLGNAASGGSSALSGLTAAVGSSTLLNGDNPISWKWALTTPEQIGFQIIESTAATGSGSPYLAEIRTLSGSTAIPLHVKNSLTGSQTLPTLLINPTWNTTGAAEAVVVDVVDTASDGGSSLLTLKVGGVAKYTFLKNGRLFAADGLVAPYVIGQHRDHNSTGGVTSTTCSSFSDGLCIAP